MVSNRERNSEKAGAALLALVLAFSTTMLATASLIVAEAEVQQQQQGVQERSQMRTRDPSSHNQALQERWRNQTEMSGAGVHMQHLALDAPTTEQYPADLRYTLRANGTATSFDDGAAEDVSVAMQLAVWKSNSRIVSMDILNGTIKVGDGEEDETIRAGSAYYLQSLQMLRVYGLVQYEGQDGATYVKMLKIISIPSSVTNELPSNEENATYTFESGANSRLDAQYQISLSGQVAAAVTGATPAETSSDAATSVGSQFTVRLESNPTTGYEWQVARIADETVVRLVDSRYVPPASNLLGAGGEQVFTFEGLKEGRTAITLEYARPFEEGPISRHTVNVAVS